MESGHKSFKEFQEWHKKEGTERRVSGGDKRKRRNRELEESDEALKSKAEKSGISLGILKQVYNRGMAAYKTGHRPGTTAQQWALARVNSFITKGKGTWGGADKDLAAKARGGTKKEQAPCWDGYKQVGMKKKGNKMVPDCVPESFSGAEKQPFKSKAGAGEFASKELEKKYRKGTPGQPKKKIKDATITEKLDYDLYHKTFSGAMQHSYKVAKKRGFKVSADSIDTQVAFGPRKPSKGKTNSYHLDLDGERNKKLHVQVYNTGNSYELNMYVESMELNERMSRKDFEKLKKGDKVEIDYGSTMAGSKTREFSVVGRSRSAKYDVDKIRLQPTDKTGGMKFFLYSRSGGDATLALGDMGASIKSYRLLEEVELNESKYKYDGKVAKISKKEFAKVHKDYKNTTKGKERMMILDPKTGSSISVPVQFEEVELDENLKKAEKLMGPSKNKQQGIEFIMKGMKVSREKATKMADEILRRAMKASSSNRAMREEEELGEDKEIPDMIKHYEDMLKSLERKKKKTPGMGFAKMKIKEIIAKLKKDLGESLELDEKLKVGDKVKFKKGIDPKTARSYGGAIRKTGKVVKDYGDGDVKVNFGGNNDMSVDAKLLVKEEVELEESSEKEVHIRMDRLSSKEITKVNSILKGYEKKGVVKSDGRGTDKGVLLRLMKPAMLSSLNRELRKFHTSADLDEGFSPAQLGKLKKAYSTVSTVDPTSSSYKKLTKMIKSQDKNALTQIAKAKVKFVSQIAATELRRSHNIKLKASEFMEEIEMNESEFKTVRGKDGKKYDVKISMDGKKFKFRVTDKTGNVGAFKVISLGQAAKLFENLEEIVDITEESGIELARKIVDRKQHMKGIDLTTAGLILQVYDKVSDKNKAKMDKMSAKQLASVVYKLLSKEEVQEDHDMYGYKLFEEVKLDEVKEPFAVVDTANGDKVVGTASSEKGAKNIIASAELPPMRIKNKKTLKIMKSKKRQMIGQPYNEETELEEAHCSSKRMKKEGITDEDVAQFIGAASAAKKAGKKNFSFGGKTYPVTISGDTAKKVLEDSLKEEMDPTEHVEKNKETGMYCVYDANGKKVKEFEDKKEADDYATKNHEKLMAVKESKYTDIEELIESSDKKDAAEMSKLVKELQPKISKSELKKEVEAMAMEKYKNKTRAKKIASFA